MDKGKDLDVGNINSLDIDDILQVLNSWDFKPIPEETDAEQTKKKSYVRISEDGMCAWLSLAEPADGELYTKEKVLSFLAENGVKAGCIQSSILAMIKKGVYNRETKIAVGMNAVAGKNGYYQFFFMTSEKPIPKYRKDGSVDYNSFHILQNVEKDEVLAIYHPAEQGKAGYNVQGKFLPLKPGKELPPLTGKGFYKSEDSKTYFAAIDGKIEYKEGILNIRNVHVIDGNVTPINGKIEFFGDIVIEGNVETGVSIRTAKTLTIKGNVEACSIYAGGDIILKKGIQGANKAKIVTKGSVYADFIEHTNVEAQGDVQANVIMNSIVNTESKIFLTGKTGALIGGYAHALEGIEAKSAGNEVEIRTLLHVGCKPDILDKKRSLYQMEKYLKEEMTDLIHQMNKIERYKAENPERIVMESEMQSLMLQKQELVQKLEKLKEDNEAVKAITRKAAKSYIKIDGPVYRGVTVCVDDNQLTISQDTSFMKYVNVAGKLSPTVLID